MTSRAIILCFVCSLLPVGKTFAAPKIEANSVAYLVFYSFARSLDMAVKNQDITISKLRLREDYQAIIAEKYFAMYRQGVSSGDNYREAKWQFETTVLQLEIAERTRTYIDASQKANVFQTKFARAIPASMKEMYDLYSVLWEADCEAKHLNVTVAGLDVAYYADLEDRGWVMVQASAMSRDRYLVRKKDKLNAIAAESIAQRSFKECTNGTVSWDWVSTIGS